MTRERTLHTPALRVRTAVRAAGYGACMAYCDQERARCYFDPNLPPETCNDRYPVCQNACTVCGMAP
jgi:hypothetical protein